MKIFHKNIFCKLGPKPKMEKNYRGGYAGLLENKDTEKMVFI